MRIEACRQAAEMFVDGKLVAGAVADKPGGAGYIPGLLDWSLLGRGLRTSQGSIGHRLLVGLTLGRSMPITTPGIKFFIQYPLEIEVQLLNTRLLFFLSRNTYGFNHV